MRPSRAGLPLVAEGGQQRFDAGEGDRVAIGLGDVLERGLGETAEVTDGVDGLLAGRAVGGA